MRNPKLKPYRLWFSSSLSLEDIGNRLISASVIVQFHYSNENVFEWIIGKTSDEKIDLNISRKHKDGGDVSKELITLFVEYAETEPPDSYIQKIGGSIAKILDTVVSLGTIDYLGGNDFRYNEQSTLSA